MNATHPAVAQEIVAAYAALLEVHARDEVHPARLDSLPYPKATIKAAVRTCVTALISTGQMTDELRDFLEVAYVSLANYVDAELAQLVSEYRQAGIALAGASLGATERVRSPAWQVLARTGRLVGEIARAIADEAQARRDEFRRWVDPA